MLAAPNLNSKAKAVPLLGFAEQEVVGGSLFSQDWENDTMGKSLLGNVTQEQHKRGICFCPSTSGAA